MSRLALLFIVLAACGGRTTGESDASTDGGADASKNDATGTGAGDASATSDGAAVTCGPNTCHAGEICCNAKCGVCTFPDECVVHDCGGP